MKKENKIILNLRWFVLGFILLFITFETYRHQVLGGDKAASVHALCPFGGLESLYSLFQSGTFIDKIFAGTFILFVITILLALFFRRSFCGLICPFGALQEFLGAFGKRIFGKSLIMPKGIDSYLRYLKYPVLLLTIFYAWQTAGLWMAPYDPWSAYAHLGGGLESIWEEAPVGVILLIITLFGSLLYDRFFCKYLCPVGAFYALVGKMSPFKVSRDETKCINCGACSKVCPVNIDVAQSHAITDSECINCQICVLSCPKEGALENRFGSKQMKAKLGISLVLGLFFIPIWVSAATDMLQTTQPTLSVEETIKPSEVRGYMTIQEAMKHTKMDKKSFYQLFKIPENVPESTKLKEISSISPDYNFEKIKHTME